MNKTGPGAWNRLTDPEGRGWGWERSTRDLVCTYAYATGTDTWGGRGLGGGGKWGENRGHL